MAVAKKCTCNLGYMVVAWILFAIGLYLLVGGFAAQFQSTAITAEALVWYFVGIVVLGLGKMSKWKSHGMCPVHGGNM